MPKPSGTLVAVLILTILLGALGILTGLAGLVNIATGGRVQQVMASLGGPGMTPEQAQLHRQLCQDIQEITARWNAVNVPLITLELGISVLMIVGAAGVLRGRVRGTRLLGVVLLAAIIVELAQLGPAMAVQYQTATLTAGFVERSMVAAGPPGRQMPPEMSATAATVGKVALVAGLAFGVGIKLAEVGFYVFGWFCLRRFRAAPEPPLLVPEVIDG